MKLSVKGLTMLAAEEGIVLSTYIDSAGVATIGVGHTAMAGPPVPTPGMKITLEEAIKLFQRDVVKYENEVSAAIKIPLVQTEYDALVIWHYNTGAAKSGTVDDKLNAQNREAAIATLLQYIKGGAGLKARRQREATLFLTGTYSKLKVPVMETLQGPRRIIDQSELGKLLTASPVTPPKPPLPDVEPPEPATKPRSLLQIIVELLVAIFFKKRK
jgi:lysozyme